MRKKTIPLGILKMGDPSEFIKDFGEGWQSGNRACADKHNLTLICLLVNLINIVYN